LFNAGKRVVINFLDFNQVQIGLGKEYLKYYILLNVKISVIHLVFLRKPIEEISMENDHKTPEKEKNDSTSTGLGLSLGAGIGLALGAGIGAAFGNVVLGAGIGVAIGPAMGMLVTSLKKK
jgi:hypothetical protein